MLLAGQMSDDSVTVLLDLGDQCQVRRRQTSMDWLCQYLFTAPLCQPLRWFGRFSFIIRRRFSDPANILHGYKLGMAEFIPE